MKKLLIALLKMLVASNRQRLYETQQTPCHSNSHKIHVRILKNEETQEWHIIIYCDVNTYFNKNTCTSTGSRKRFYVSFKVQFKFSITCICTQLEHSISGTERNTCTEDSLDFGLITVEDGNHEGWTFDVSCTCQLRNLWHQTFSMIISIVCCFHPFHCVFRIVFFISQQISLIIAIVKNCHTILKHHIR